MSSAGKSFIVTALCRLFSNLGYKVCPFKSQNMALNSGVTFDGKEMGRAQIVQAEAARTIPDVRMNPILLKPNSDVGSQVIVMGKPIGNMNAKEYYEYKTSLIPVIKDAFYSLEKEYDVIIVEGAGSPAEINLKENDIVNMGLAKMLDLNVLLVGDIDLGGVFAQLLGTLEWLSDDERNRVKGLIINKFRGDRSLLEPGINMLEDKTDKNVIGVIPYCNVKIDEEDSVTINPLGKSDNKCEVIYKKIINIYIVKLPHMSNFTDFTPLCLLPYVNVLYIDSVPNNNPDLLIIPGTKSTISDLKWMNENGLSQYIVKNASVTPIIGICGGNQILGEEIFDESGVEGDTYIRGLSLIKQRTEIKPEKTLTRCVSMIKCEKGFFKCLNSIVCEGYEIHSGVTSVSEEPVDVFGTYVHGLFDKEELTKALITGLLNRKGIKDSSFYTDMIKDYGNYKDIEYDKAAEVIKDSIDINELKYIMGII